MNRSLLAFALMVITCGSLAMAQDRPRPPHDDQDNDRPMPPDGDRFPGGPGGPGGPMRGPGGPGGPGMRPDGGKLEALRNYMDVVDRFARVARDPTTAGIAAVVSASDLMRQRGPDAAVEYFTKLLPEVKNEPVQRAIRIQLVDLYRQQHQDDKMLEQLDILIKGAPLGAGAPTPPAPPAP